MGKWGLARRHFLQVGRALEIIRDFVDDRSEEAFALVAHAIGPGS